MSSSRPPAPAGGARRHIARTAVLAPGRAGRRRSGPGPAAVCRAARHNITSVAAPGRSRARPLRAPGSRPPAGGSPDDPVREMAPLAPGRRPSGSRPGLPALGSAPIALIRKRRRLCRHAPVGVPNGYLCASVLADHGLCSSGRSGGPGGSGASHAASQKGWRALRVHRHSAARVSLTQPPAACIRRSPRRRKGPPSTARTVAGTSGCSPAIPGAW